MTSRRSPWSLIGSGFGLLVLAVVVFVALISVQFGGFLTLAISGLLALVGVALLLGGAIGLGVRSGSR